MIILMKKIQLTLNAPALEQAGESPLFSVLFDDVSPSLMWPGYLDCRVNDSDRVELFNTAFVISIMEVMYTPQTDGEPDSTTESAEA